MGKKRNPTKPKPAVAKRNQEVIEVVIADLKPHPLQDRLFPDESDAEPEALARDMVERGQQHPIEITPDLTIIGGHRRVVAAKHVGWPMIDAVIRQDLAEMGAAAIERHLVADNFARRQLTPLGRIRCAEHLAKLADQANRQPSQQGDEVRSHKRVRDAVGEALGISGREAGRLLAAAKAPPEVQRAHERGEISLTLAGAVARWPADRLAGAVARIRRGESANPTSPSIGQNSAVAQFFQVFSIVSRCATAVGESFGGYFFAKGV